MTRNHSRTVLEAIRALVEITWWMLLTVAPAQLLLSVAGAMGWVRLNGLGNIATQISLPGPPGVELSTGQVQLAVLSPATAIVAGLCWLGMVGSSLPVVWQLRRILRGLATRPFDHETARRMRLLGPLVAAASAVNFVLGGVCSAVVAAAAPVPGAQLALSWGVLFWGLAAAAGVVMFAEALRAATVLREDGDLTI